MTAVSKTTLQAEADQIATETSRRMNTANRVGTCLRNIIDSTQTVVTVPLQTGATAEIATTNAALIQAAIDAFGPSGTMIQLPDGTFYTYPVGVVYSNVHIRGGGRGVTKMVMGPSPLVDQNEMFRFGITASGSTPVPISNCSIGCMEIDGNKANQVNGSDPAGSNAAGVGVVTVAGMTIYDMEVHDCDGYGISFFGTDYAGRSDWLVFDVETHSNNYDGIDIKGGATNKPTRIEFEHVYSHDNGPGNIVGRDSVGFDLRGERITLINCTANTNTQNGIRIRDGSDGCYSADLVSCFADGNTTAGLQVDAVATGVYSVHGGRFNGNSAYGIRQEGGTLTMHGVTASGQARGYTNFTTACTAYLNECIFEDNTSWGVRADVAGTVVKLRGGVVRRNGSEGVRIACGTFAMHETDLLDNDTSNTNHAGIILLSTCTNWRMEGGRATNVEGTTQNWGVEFQAGSFPGVLNMYLTGNSSTGITGAIPTGTLFYGFNGRSVPTGI